MKFLVDTSVWSLLLRRRFGTVLSTEQQDAVALLREAILAQRVAIVGPVRQEVLSGIKHEAQFQKLQSALGGFPDVPLSERHFEEAARLFNLCQARGVTCGSTGILICAVAILEGLDVLTVDQGLKRCVEVLRSEGLMA
jgi:predicted nucleic acid-binding protein